MHPMKLPIVLWLLWGFGSPGVAGEFYQQFSSSIATNRGTYIPLDEYPFLVDTNNTSAKLTNAVVNLKDLKEHGEISGVRLGMTMDEAVARWGKPPSGYAPMGCLHGLPTFIYEGAALAFESNRLETIYFYPRAIMFGALSRDSKLEDFIAALGPPTDRLTAGRACNLAYLLPRANLRLVFFDDRLESIWLERIPSRAQPWKLDPSGTPQGAADGRRPFSSETNRTSAPAASRRSP
jgi:hypothetical protein